MRAPAPAPPRGFRKSIPIKVKLESVLMHGPIFDADGERVCKVEDLDFDHQPPIQLRVWDEETQDTIPPCNDPEHIVPMVREGHRAKTAKTDIPEIAKTKRMASDQDEFRRKILSRQCGDKREPKGKIKSRGFQKKKTKE